MSQISQTVRTIGVLVGRDLVGDALIKLPFLRALRRAYPQAAIHWISTQGPTAFADLLREATRNLIDVVEECPPWLEAEEKTSNFQPLEHVPTRLMDVFLPGHALVFCLSSRFTRTVAGLSPSTLSRSALASNPQPPFFDLVIDTRNRWREARAAKQIPHQLFVGMAWHGLVSEPWPSLRAVIQPPQHLCDRLLQLVELAAGYRPSTKGSLVLSQGLLHIARQLLPAGKIYVGLAPGAGNAAKIWPRYKFEQVAAQQIAAGRVPVFLLGPQELPWYDELAATIPQARFPLQEIDIWRTAQLTIDHTLAVASLLNVAVANDSGVGHMLAAVDCPLISLFGPTSPAKLAPRVSHGMVIAAQSFGHTDHMTAISVEAVDQAIERMLHNLKVRPV